MGQPRTQQLGWVWCAAAAVLFGAATPTTKLLVGNVGSVTLAGLLYLGAAIALSPRAMREPRPVPTPQQRARLLLAICFGGGLAPVLLVLALVRTSAATVSLFLNVELVATAVIARCFLQEHLGRRAATGIVVVALGGVVLAGTHSAGIGVGAILVVAACLCWGLDNAITASLDAYTPAQITVAKGYVAGTVNLVLGIALNGWPAPRFALAALAIGSVGYGASIAMWITGARLIGAARGQVIFALAPFVGALLAWPINGEVLTNGAIVAFAMSLAGVLIVGSAHHAHSHRHEAIVHAHPINPADPHHAIGAIDVLAGGRHRHRPLVHEHEHLPDIHHRHDH